MDTMRLPYRNDRAGNLRACLLAGLIAALAFAACMPSRPTPTPTPTPNANPVLPPAATALPTLTPEPTVEPTATLSPTPIPPPPQQVGPESFPPGVNPLTGLPVDDPAVLDRRPLHLINQGRYFLT